MSQPMSQDPMPDFRLTTQDTEDDLGMESEPQDLSLYGAGNQLAVPQAGARSSSASSYGSVNEEAVSKGKMDVRVVTCKRSNSVLQSGMPVYKMDTDPRGLALIIEIEEYTNDVYSRRQGSHVDVSNLRKLFEQLSFSIVYHKDLNKRDFRDQIRNFAQRQEHADSDMAIIVILSHGRDGHIYTADGCTVNTETIYEKFNNKEAPLLQGKPKFFIIQACRGDSTDQPHSADVSFASPTRKRRAQGHDRDSDPFTSSDVMRARPTWEDMVIAYSTIPGYASIRDHENGTWFIQSLVEVFMHHAYEKELIDLLRMTSERLSHFTNEENEKQTCNVEMRHLYKRIYFNPGIPRSRPGLTRSVSTPPASPKRGQDH